MVRPLAREYFIHREDGDYKYRIARVPIWAAHERVFRRNDGSHYKVTVTPEKLREFAKKHNKRFRQDGYRAPIHEVHNDGRPVPNEEVAYAGRMTVGKAEFEGKPQDILFLDFLIKDDEALNKVKSNPYRSPEISFDREELSSLALMRREAPFFKFPNFKAVMKDENEETDEFALVAVGETESYPAPLYRDTAEYHYAESGMKNAMTEQTEEEEGDYMAGSPDATVSEDSPAEEGDSSGEDKQFYACMSRYMQSPEGKQAMSKCIDNHLSQMFSEMEEPEDTEGDAPAALITKTPEEGYQEEAVAKYSENDFELQGKLQGYEERIRSLEKDKELQDVTYRALRETSGISRGDDELFSEKIQAIYKEGGAKGVELFVKGLKSAAPAVEKDAPESIKDVADDAPPEVAKYSNDPVKFEKASKLYQEFHSLSRGMREGLTPADYISSGLHEKY